AGSRAVSSHTGTLAGSDTAYDTAFQQAGVIRAESVGDLFALSTALAYQPLPDGNRVAIITNAGGPGIMATDACEKMGIELAQLELETVEFLMEVLPPAANHHNPIDVLGDARSDRYQPALEAAVKDTNVDAVIFLLTPQAMTDIKEIAQGVVKVAGLSNKPILACFMGGKEVAAGNKVLAAGCVPFYDFPENAAKALKGMIDQKLWMETPVDKPTFIEVDTSPARKTLERCRTAGRLKLNEMEAREIVAAYGIPLPKAKLASNPKQVAESAEEIGFPLVMKIISPDILHKSDMGGVIVGISSEQEALNAYQEIMLRARRYSPDADIWGVAVQEMVTPGRETIIGVSEDPTFGHMVMFGIGGIYVEVIKDVQFGITPLSEKHARSMITELRSYPLLEGVRGEKASDMDAMVDCLLRISQMVVDFPEIVELDINPLFVYPEGQGVMAVDARIVIAAE
ncbi:MAG: acetate--CoA ligase family protein, partial [Chloroflexota bacterium]